MEQGFKDTSSSKANDDRADAISFRSAISACLYRSLVIALQREQVR